MTITQSISSKTADSRSEVLLFVSLARGKVYRAKSGVFVSRDWIGGIEDGSIKFNRTRSNDKEKATTDLSNLCSDIKTWYNQRKDIPGAICRDSFKQFIVECIAKRNGVEAVENTADSDPDDQREETEAPDLFDHLKTYIDKYLIEDGRQSKYGKVLYCHLVRFSKYMAIETKSDYGLDIDTVDADMLTQFKHYLLNEHNLFAKAKNGKMRVLKKYKSVYDDNSSLYDNNAPHKKYVPEPKGMNTVVGLMRMLRRFYNWAKEQELTHNYPFHNKSNKRGYDIGREVYGTPFYLTVEERNKVRDYDFSKSPAMAVARDIFIFACWTGPRISDLWRLTRSNIIKTRKGKTALAYVPQKTSKERKEHVEIPLSEDALTIVARYKNHPKCKDRLLPFTCQQVYNRNIKKMLKIVGIDRAVPVINSVTGEEEMRPLYEVGSSHMARRTFVGTLYREVHDPNVIGRMSGHAEGSRAFARYREIDEDLKEDILSKIK